MISIHDIAALAALRRDLRIEPNHLRQVRNAFYKKHVTAAQALAQLPEGVRTPFAQAVAFHALDLESRHDSRLDGASKLIYRTSAGRLLEAVILRIKTGRTSLCVSSQIGCKARCEFCATGHMGMAHNLTRAEILDQVIGANRLLSQEGRAVRNVVFMGMGEPLHNEAEVYEAIAVLLSPRCFNLAPCHVLVSTVGIPDAMVRCAERFPGLGMALSLHSARQVERERLIPLARCYSLETLRRAITRVTSIQRRSLMIEYLMLDRLNDTDEDVHALLTYLRGLDVHVNLIPYNPIDDAPGFRGTAPDRRRAFAEALVAAGLVVTIRYSLGADIAAACGQLVQRRDPQDRARVAVSPE